jgi:hypothetical protein
MSYLKITEMILALYEFLQVAYLVIAHRGNRKDGIFASLKAERVVTAWEQRVVHVEGSYLCTERIDSAVLSHIQLLQIYIWNVS